MSVKVKQRDITDCGAACLASIAAHYRLKMPVARIRQLAGTDSKGTTVLGLVEGAAKMGFLAKGVRGPWESLFKIPRPAIAHLVVKKVLHHFVVITDVKKEYIKIMDPGDGRIHKVPLDVFKEQWTGVLVLITPGEKFKAGSEGISTAGRLLNLVKSSRGILLQVLTGAIAYSLLGLSMSLYVGKLVDNVLPGGNINLLNLLGVVMICIIILRLLLYTFQTLFVLRVGQKMDATLILGYYQHLLRLPQSFFDSMRTGEIISRIGDAVKIRNFINEISVNFILNLFIVLVSFTLMFTFYWKLALIMVAVVPIYVSIYFLSNRFNRKIQRNVMEKSADLEVQLVESLNSAGTIKRLGLEDFSNIKTETRFVSLLGTIYKSGLYNIFSSDSTNFVSQLATVMVLWIGSLFAIRSEITPGELLSFYSVAGYFTAPVTALIAFNRTLQDARIAAERLFEIFDLDIESETTKVELKSDMIEDIQFRNVSFRYGMREEVFRSLNLTIRKGEITAITGESGSGKSTLASLVQNVYKLNSGHIFIGRYDLQCLTNRSLKKIISVVPQKIDIFSGTVSENIAVGEYNPDIRKIIDICNRLGMASFIELLPEGYNTLLGEKGTALSGGQQQRIAIARALYRNPEILILDEATSSLDSMAEKCVHDTLQLLKESGKTIIIIAHRFSTISLAQRIIVLDKGEVVQDGTINELSQAEGHFSRLWKYRKTGIEDSVNA
jgi:ATP-binding cassette, subfamily C, bacteriocin exporter